MSNQVWREQTRANGEIDFTTENGAYLGAVVHHPRIPGMWMAMFKTYDVRRSGMKKYKTFHGARVCVQRELQNYLSEITSAS